MGDFNPDEDVLTVEAAEELLSSKGIGLEAGSLEMKIGKVLLFAIWAAENQDQIAILSGLPLSEVNMIASVLKKNGVFGAGLNLRHDYLEGEHSGIALCSDIACGMNQLVTFVKNGERWYRMTEDGIEHVEKELLPMPGAQEMFDNLDAAAGTKPGQWREDWDKAQKKKPRK